jgi:hypothetical protein
MISSSMLDESDCAAVARTKCKPDSAAGFDMEGYAIAEAVKSHNRWQEHLGQPKVVFLGCIKGVADKSSKDRADAKAVVESQERAVRRATAVCLHLVQHRLLKSTDLTSERARKGEELHTLANLLDAAGDSRAPPKQPARTNPKKELVDFTAARLAHALQSRGRVQVWWARLDVVSAKDAVAVLRSPKSKATDLAACMQLRVRADPGGAGAKRERDEPSPPDEGADAGDQGPKPARKLRRKE